MNRQPRCTIHSSSANRCKPEAVSRIGVNGGPIIRPISELMRLDRVRYARVSSEHQEPQAVVIDYVTTGVPGTDMSMRCAPKNLKQN